LESSRTLLFPVEVQGETIGQHTHPRLGVALLEPQHPVQYRIPQISRRVRPAFVQHRREALGAPFGRALGIDEQPRGLGGENPPTIIDLILMGTPFQTLVSR